MLPPPIHLTTSHAWSQCSVDQCRHSSLVSTLNLSAKIGHYRFLDLTILNIILIVTCNVQVDSGNNMELKMVKSLAIPTRHYMVSMMVLYCFTCNKAVRLKAPRQAGRLYEICHERCTSGLAGTRICSSS